MKFLKYTTYVIMAITFLLVIVLYIIKTQRYSKEWVEDIKVNKNETLSIEFIQSQRKTYGGHGFSWGGGDFKNKIKFDYNGRTYFHKTSYNLIIIREYNGHFYLVYYDRKTYKKRISFRFYKSTKKGNFEEIEPTKFPKHIVIQNRGFGKTDSPERLIGLDPKKMFYSKTAMLWYMVEGKQKVFDYDYKNYSIKLSFIKAYKEKYITNIAEE